MTSDSNAAAQTQGATGEFHASRPADEPVTTHGHQPGKIVSEADAAPVFHAQAIPAGTAPPESTFEPNTSAEAGGAPAAASGTIPGATSGDVHQGLGKPVQGQSGAEVRHDGKSHSKAEHSGLTGVSTAPSGGADKQ